MSLSNWFSSSSFGVFDGWCSIVDFVDVGEGVVTGIKGRLIATDGGWRSRGALLVVVDDDGNGCKEGPVISCGVKRGRSDEEGAGWDEGFFCWAFLTMNSSTGFSQFLLRIDDDELVNTLGDEVVCRGEDRRWDGEIETRFDGGTFFIVVSGAVRLRSLGDDVVITLRVVGEVVVTILEVVVEEEQVTDRVGEVDFFWKRLMKKILYFIDLKNSLQYLLKTHCSTFIILW